MLSAVRCRVIASGGVGSDEDAARLAELERTHANFDGIILGKALYEKRIDLGQLVARASLHGR